MSLQDKITEQLKTAMKEHKQDVVDALRMLQAGLKNKKIELQRELEDSEVIQELKRQSKQLADALGDFVKAERHDLSDKTKKEMALIQQFLPATMERTEIKKHVVNIATEVGATTIKDMGKLMGAVMKALGAAVNGEDVKAEVEEFLKNR